MSVYYTDMTTVKDPVLMLHLNLSEGKVVAQAGRRRHRFERNDHEGLGKLFLKHPYARVIYSSSVNHPRDYGFPATYDIYKRLVIPASLWMQRRIAVRIPPLPLEGADKVVEAALMEAGDLFPKHILLDVGKKEGVLITFRERQELNMFLDGLKYGERLVRISRKAKRVPTGRRV